MSDRASEGNSLLLSAANFGRKAVGDIWQLDEIEQFFNAGIACRAGIASFLQAEADVLSDRHMRKQGVILKDHPYSALLRRERGHILPVYVKTTGRGIDQPGDDLKQGGLPATGRSEKGQKLTVQNSKVGWLQRDHIAVLFGNTCESEVGHYNRASGNAPPTEIGGPGRFWADTEHMEPGSRQIPLSNAIARIGPLC